MLQDLVARILTFGGPPVRGVIHVGAHDGREFETYELHGIRHQVWVEPHPDYYARLIAHVCVRPEVMAFMLACGRSAGRADLFVLAGNDGMSNSLLLPKQHLVYHPQLPVCSKIQVSVLPLDHVLSTHAVDSRNFNLLVLDVQGYELEVLCGAAALVPQLDYAWVEVNSEETYTGCALVDDIDLWFRAFSFYRVYTDWFGPNKSYGDALYTRQAIRV